MKILCLDFDGVIHSYTSGWRGAGIIPDPPVPGALDFIKDATGEFEVHIFSSRSGLEGGMKAMQSWLEVVAGEKYGMLPFWLDLIKWPTEKPPAFLTIDDRAITFTGEWPDMEMLKKFKPWNQK